MCILETLLVETLSTCTLLKTLEFMGEKCMGQIVLTEASVIPRKGHSVLVSLI